MTKSGRKGSSRFVWRCVLAAVVVIAYAGACALVSRTLTEWWIPFAFSIALAFLAGVFLWKIWRWFTGSGRFIWNFLVCAVALTGIFSSAFYIVNYACADRATTHEEQAEVARVYYKVRHHSRRVGRNRYVQGEAYNVHFMEVKMSNGMLKELEIPYDCYRRTRKGERVTLPVAMGALGVPVILY